jgi:hypothetical protein
MGYFRGRVTFVRYRVDRSVPRLFGPEHLERLTAHVIGTQRTAEKDGIEVGWITGEDILDTAFDLAKNILHFALRIDRQTLPGDLLRSYTNAELRALGAQNPSGRPTRAQKKEAREAARERLEAEAKDGRFAQRTAYPVLWDRQTRYLLVGTFSSRALEQAEKLFRETFRCDLCRLDADALAQRWAESNKQEGRWSTLRPTPFVLGREAGEVAWVKDPARHDYLGNEFLLWLWFILETEGDSLSLADGSTATAMLAQTLMLECPHGLSGNEILRTEAPAKLPEARRAIQAGKLPRRAGLVLVRHDQQYELSLQAERFAVSAAKLPPTEADDERSRLEDRVSQLRHLIETLDLLYETFLQRRLKSDWQKEQQRLQQWLQQKERGPRAAASLWPL